MRKPILFPVLIIAFSGWFSSCAPSVKTALTNPVENSVNSNNSYFLILEKGQSRPADSREIGVIKISDSGFSINCSYEKVLQLAKTATLKAGGNAMQIREHKQPDAWSTCHRLEVVMLITEADPDYFLRLATNKAKAKYDSLVAANPDTSKFVFVEQQPQFRGGDKALMNYLSSSVRYPKTAFKDRISGLVVASFIVSETGEISDPVIQKSVREDIDQELIRIIMSMPPWIPGFQNGKAVKTKFTIPMRFSSGSSKSQKKS